MRARLLILPVVATLAFVVGCGDSDDHESTTLRLESRPLVPEVIDSSDTGPSPGDTHVFSGPLFEEDGDRQVGRLEGTGTITDIEEGGGEQIDRRASIVQFTLEDGTLVVGGVLPGPTRTARVTEDVTRPILGGTGAYRSARGEATQSALPGGGLRHVLEIETPSD